VSTSVGKNLLGTFHQPRTVLIDPNVLTTLPSREYRAGLYEASSVESSKCWIVRLFEDRRREILDRDNGVVEKVIAESVRLKARL